MKRKALLIILCTIPLWGIAQSDSTAGGPPTDKEKAEMLFKGNYYFIDVNEILSGSANAQLPECTIDLIRRITTFSKSNHKTIRLVFITHFSKNEYERYTPNDAQIAFNMMRKLMGAGVKITMEETRYDNADAFGLVKISID